MANYACNNITFTTKANEKNLLDLEFLVTNIDYLYNKSKYGQVDEITKTISQAYEKPEYNFDRRDCFSWIQDDVIYYNKDYDEYAYEIMIESAWEPAISRVREWVQSIYPNIDVIGTCEEPGFEIYINTDTEGKYYQNRYYAVRIDKDGRLDEYFYEDISEVVNLVSPYISLNKESINISDIQNKLKEYNTSDNKINDIDTIWVHEYDDEDLCTFGY